MARGQSLLDEHGVDLLGAVHAPRERELDVGGPARARDEVDRGAARAGSDAVMPGLQREPGLQQGLDEHLSADEIDRILGVPAPRSEA